MKKTLFFLILFFICTKAHATFRAEIPGLDALGVMVSADLSIPCDDNAIMKYDLATATWGCEADATGAGANITVKENDTSVSSTISTVDFGLGFDATQSPSGEINVSQDLSEVVTGDIAFTANVSNINPDTVSNDELAPQAVSTDQIRAMNLPTDEYCLTYENDGTGRGEWQTCGSGGGDSITVNSSAATDPDFLDGDVDWTLTGGNSITATVACSGCVDITDMASDSVSNDELTAQSVSTDLLQATDLPNDEEIPTYESSTPGRFQWHTCAEITGSADLCDGSDAGGTDTNAVKEYWWPSSASLPLELSDSIPPIGKIAGTNIDALTVDFDSATDECRTVSFKVPSDVQSGSTVTFRVHWRAAIASPDANVVWNFRSTVGASDNVSPDSALTTDSTTDSAGTVIGRLTVTTWTQTLSNLGWSANEQIDGEFCRDANNTADTASFDALTTGFGVDLPRA